MEHAAPDPARPPARTGPAGTLRGERTRDDAEQAELERLTGSRFVASAGDDEMDASLGDEAT